MGTARTVRQGDSGNRRTYPRHIQQRQQAGALQTLRVERSQGEAARASVWSAGACSRLRALRGPKSTASIMLSLGEARVWGGHSCSPRRLALSHYEDGMFRPYISLALFAGLRPGELARITWSGFDFVAKTQRIRSAASKVRARRIIALSDNLLAWLMTCKGRVIAPGNFQDEFGDVRRMAQFRVSVRRAGRRPALEPRCAQTHCAELQARSDEE